MAGEKINLGPVFQRTGWALVLVGSLSVSTLFAKDTCLECHLQLDDKNLRDPALHIKGDVHYLRELSCSACHGGDPKEEDPELSMSPARGFVGKPKPAQIPAFCGRCHSDVEYMKRFNPKLPTDQLAQYKTSVHGKRLLKGDTLVANCVSCHGVHGILAPTDTRSPVFKTNIPKTCAGCHADERRMGRYGIPTNQYAEYVQSVHGELLLKEGEQSAAACTDCHGSHGATPPGLADIAGACGECHPANRDLFEKSPHMAPFKDAGLPQCATCHDHHKVLRPADDFLGVGPGAVCITCHEAGSKGYAAAQALKADLDSLKAAVADARGTVKKAEIAGVRVGLAKFDLKACEDAVIHSRSALHSFSTADFQAITKTGMEQAARVKEAALVSLEDLDTRRKGLVFSAVLILFLCVGLWLKIRQLDKKMENR